MHFATKPLDCFADQVPAFGQFWPVGESRGDELGKPTGRCDQLDGNESRLLGDERQRLSLLAQHAGQAD